jgi:selenocysteine lyase/cysteine desulfurase
VTVRETGVRVSPHGYNSNDDIDRVLAVLAS